MFQYPHYNFQKIFQESISSPPPPPLENLPVSSIDLRGFAAGLKTVTNQDRNGQGVHFHSGTDETLKGVESIGVILKLVDYKVPQEVFRRFRDIPYFQDHATLENLFE